MFFLRKECKEKTTYNICSNPAQNDLSTRINYYRFITAIQH